MKYDKEKLDELIVGYLTDNLHAEELVELNSWMDASEENITYMNEYCHIWMVTKALTNPNEFDNKAAFNKFSKKVKTSIVLQDTANYVSRKQFKIKTSFLRIAAFIIVFFGLGFIAKNLLIKRSTDSLITCQEIIVPIGSQTTVLLPDQSVVILNAGSKIRYYSNFGVKDREVWLQGEGFFTVAKNKEKPFIVRAGSLVIKALGTKFNVKAYPLENTIETALIEGKVKVERLQNDNLNHKSVAGLGILVPNECIIYTKDKVENNINFLSILQTPYDELDRASDLEMSHLTNISFIKNVDLRSIISWKEKRWIIKRERLDKLAILLERKYDVKIIFQNESLKSLRFSGTIEDESIDQVINAVSLTSAVLYKIEGRTIYLRNNSPLIPDYNHVPNK